MSSTSRMSRRAILAGATSIPLVSAGALASKGQALDDSELRRLWSEYLAQNAAHAAAQEKYRPVHAAFEAELPPCPDGVLLSDHWDDHQWLRQKHGLDQLYDAWCAADRAMRETIATIRQTRAVGLFGMSVKLAALPNECDPPKTIRML